MTTLVGWQLTVDAGPHHDPEEIDAALESAVGEDGVEVLLSVSYGDHDAEPANRYDPTEDLKTVSSRFPEALFTLTATDCENHNRPEEHGYRRIYLKGGKSQEADAAVVFSPFDGLKPS